MAKLKAKITFEWEYNANPKHYGEESITIEDMIRMDKVSADDDIFLFLESCKEEPTIEITEVKS